MSNKISNMKQAAENDGEKKFVQLRLPTNLAEMLERSARAANRKLPSEIIYRLQEGPTAGGADALLYGWKDPERNKMLGAALGILAGRLEVAGPMTEDAVRDRAAVLGMLGLALSIVLKSLGADEKLLSEDEWNFATLEARKFTNELQRPERGIGPRPDLAIISHVANAEPMSALKKTGG